MYRNATIIKDKKGRDVLLRSAKEKDAEALIDYMKITAAETPFLLREPDEISLTIEQEQAFIKAKKNSENELLLIAELLNFLKQVKSQSEFTEEDQYGRDL